MPKPRFASSISFTLGTREVSFTRGTGEEYITSNCMERQFEKEVCFKLGKGEVLSH